MIITEPNRFVAEVHDRMPVLLRPEQFDAWLDGSAGKEVLVPAPRTCCQASGVEAREQLEGAEGGRDVDRSGGPGGVRYRRKSP